MKLPPRLATLNEIVRVGVMPNFYVDDAAAAATIARAAVVGGCTVLEFVNRGPSAVDVFTTLAAEARRDLPSLVLGAGTVTEPATAAQYVNAGARFIVGPNLNVDVARLCARRGAVYAAGVATATELSAALEAGADLLKLFPARELGGPAAVRALLGPFAHAPIMPSGGVSADAAEVRAYVEAGAVCLSIGGALFPRDAIAAGDWPRLEAGFRAAVEAVAAARA